MPRNFFIDKLRIPKRLQKLIYTATGSDPSDVVQAEMWRTDATEFSSTDKSVELTVSRFGRHVVHANNYNFGNVRGTKVKTSGAWYYETKLYIAGNVGPGFANASASLTAYAGNDTNGSVYFNTGFVSYNGNAGTYAAAVALDVIQSFIDIDLKKIWYGKNGVWNGDPSARTGGISVPDIGNAIYPVLCAQTPSDTVRANFGATPFLYSIPTGGLAWDAEEVVDPPVVVAKRSHFWF